jgi:hypothetical protein
MDKCRMDARLLLDLDGLFTTRWTTNSIVIFLNTLGHFFCCCSRYLETDLDLFFAMELLLSVAYLYLSPTSRSVNSSFRSRISRPVIPMGAHGGERPFLILTRDHRGPSLLPSISVRTFITSIPDNASDRWKPPPSPEIDPHLSSTA